MSGIFCDFGSIFQSQVYISNFEADKWHLHVFLSNNFMEAHGMGQLQKHLVSIFIFFVSSYGCAYYFFQRNGGNIL